MSKEQVNVLGALEGYVSSKPELNLMSVGRQVAKLIRYFITHSGILNSNGDPKPTQKEYADVTPQVMLTFANAEGQVVTDRMNAKSFIKWDAVEDEKRKAGFVNGKDDKGKTVKVPIKAIDGYACYEEDGKWYRFEDKEGTRKAMARFDSLFFALQVPEGTSLEEGLKLAIDSEIPIEINVTSKLYDGREHLEVGNYRKTSEEL
jgi:hypothetical protein